MNGKAEPAQHTANPEILGQILAVDNANAEDVVLDAAIAQRGGAFVNALLAARVGDERVRRSTREQQHGCPGAFDHQQCPVLADRVAHVEQSRAVGGAYALDCDWRSDDVLAGAEHPRQTLARQVNVAVEEQKVREVAPLIERRNDGVAGAGDQAFVGDGHQRERDIFALEGQQCA